MHCSFFIMRGIFNIMCGGLNNMLCSFLLMRSGFIIMRNRSCKWCSILIITCCAFVSCRATFLLCIVCFTLFAVHNCILMLNMYKHTTSSSMHCSFFVMRCISNIMCDGLNNMRCSFLIMRSGFVIMRSRSCKWCSSLIITCAFVKCRASFSFMYSGYYIICCRPPIIRDGKIFMCCGYIFPTKHSTLTPVDMEWRDSS